MDAAVEAVLDLDAALRCLAEAEEDRRRPELCRGRYVVVAYEQGARDEDFDEDCDDEGLDEDAEEALRDVAVLGEAASLYDAFDLLAPGIVESFECDDAAEALEVLLDGREETAEDRRRLAPIRSAERRLVASVLLGYAGPMDTETGRLSQGLYVGAAPLLFPGARFVFLSTAAPPHQEMAYGILELQPVGAPTAVERALLEASRRGDTAAMTQALKAGAGVDALDERGMGALHLAVAHRKLGAVRALLDAGADPGLQAAYGNAPHFAALDGKRRVMPCAAVIEDAGHERILRALVEAGTPVRVRDRLDATLLDMALATLPYPEETLRFLVSAGAESGCLEGMSLGRLLDRLPHGSPRKLAEHLNRVRFLLDPGTDPRGADKEPGASVGRESEPALHVLLGHTGYHEREVSGEMLLALVEEILRHGVRDVPYNGRTAREHAEGWVTYGLAHYRPVVERLRAEAAGAEPA
ncbi:ankyrin repeat domain-containing protein [Streptomyces sp. BP-8]|uniref:Ankyrin repeat domain-containing protein n=1 Tax=Streptomyces sirii TaxID=3127701 RepID=A0ABZ2QIW7_9ACTN